MGTSFRSDWRPLFQFRLRTLFFLLLYVAVGLAWLRFTWDEHFGWRTYHPGKWGIVACIPMLIAFGWVASGRQSRLPVAFSIFAAGWLLAMWNQANGIFICWCCTSVSGDRSMWPVYFQEGVNLTMVGGFTLPVACGVPAIHGAVARKVRMEKSEWLAFAACSVAIVCVAVLYLAVSLTFGTWFYGPVLFG
jgi:hypothetical protein